VQQENTLLWDEVVERNKLVPEGLDAVTGLPDVDVALDDVVIGAVGASPVAGQ